MTPATKTDETLSRTSDETSAGKVEGQTSINWKVPIATALITALTTLLVSYWQFHTPKSSESPQTSGITISGTVHGRNGGPLAGAGVSLIMGKESRQIPSDSSGFFTFSGLTPDEGRITFSADGYRPFSRILTPQSYKDTFDIALSPLDEQAPLPSGQTTNSEQSAPIESPGPKPFRARAEANVGWSYEIGEGGRPDYDSAMKWYLKAARDGDAKADWNIGRLYEFGFGVPKDFDKAREWYQKGVDKGDEQAKEFISDIGRNRPY